MSCVFRGYLEVLKVIKQISFPSLITNVQIPPFVFLPWGIEKMSLCEVTSLSLADKSIQRYFLCTIFTFQSSTNLSFKWVSCFWRMYFAAILHSEFIILWTSLPSYYFCISGRPSICAHHFCCLQFVVNFYQLERR